MKSLPFVLLLAAAAAAAGCADQPSTQVLTGHVTTSGALAVRALSNGTVVTAARVRSDGSFTLSLPAGTHYQLQVLTGSGVQHVLDRHSAALAFDVCQPTDPFDLGGMGEGGGMGSGSGGCGTPPPMCDPSTGSNCDPPPMCDPMTDPMCVPPPPVCDASGNCMCDPTTEADCPLPPPPCPDPMDPSSCQDPCMADPMQCGCDPSNGQMCWPPPPDCDAAGNCTGMVPQHPPGNFGCGGA